MGYALTAMGRNDNQVDGVDLSIVGNLVTGIPDRHLKLNPFVQRPAVALLELLVNVISTTAVIDGFPHHPRFPRVEIRQHMEHMDLPSVRHKGKGILQDTVGSTRKIGGNKNLIRRKQSHRVMGIGAGKARAWGREGRGLKRLDYKPGDVNRAM